MATDTAFDKPARKLPTWEFKPNKELTLKEAIQKLNFLEREQARIDRKLLKAFALLKDIMP